MSEGDGAVAVADGNPNTAEGLTLEPLIADSGLNSEESRKLVYKDGDFCLFRPKSVEEIDSKDVMKIQENLSVLMSSLPSEEEVKMFQILIALRIKYWTLKPGCGLVTSFDTGLISDAAQVYTCLINLEGGKNTKLILCCLSKRTEGLDLFIPELDNYVGRVKSQLQKLSFSDPDNITLDHDTLKLLQSWTKTITYLNTAVFNYQSYLPVLLHSALMKPVKFSGNDKHAISELQLLIKACSVDVLTNEGDKQLVDIDDGDCVIVSVVSSTELEISSSEKSQFSELWATKLIAKGPKEADSFYLKAIINKFKLKIIQDVNAVKRLVRDAEVNYYGLYNLINDAKHSKETETIAVLHSIKEYHSKQTATAAEQQPSSTSSGKKIPEPSNKPLIVF